MPRPRFTLRWLMLGVAVLAIALGVDGLRRRRAHWLGLAYLHAAAERSDLDRAARQPWILVAPDPAEPE